MTFFAEPDHWLAGKTPRRPSRRLSPAKWSNWPVHLQISLAVALAGGCLAAFEWLLPGVAGAWRQAATLLLHELGHAAAARDVHSITLRADGSGEAIISGGDPALMAIMGPLLPPIVGAVLFAFAAVRFGCAILLVSSALGFAFAASTFDAETPVRTALYGLAVFSFCTGALGLPHLLQSTALLFLAVLLALGSLNALPYLWIESVPARASLLAVQGPLPQSIPSDVRNLADALLLDVAEARGLMILAMVAAWLLAFAVVARFIHVYRHH